MSEIYLSLSDISLRYLLSNVFLHILISNIFCEWEKLRSRLVRLLISWERTDSSGPTEAFRVVTLLTDFPLAKSKEPPNELMLEKVRLIKQHYGCTVKLWML